MTTMRRILLVIAIAVLVGCAHTGRFVHKRQFHIESVDFRPDGTFLFTCWFDDGVGTVEVTGSWRPGEGKKTAVSTVPGLEASERSSCVHLRGKETWEYRLNGWHRGVEGPFRRADG